MTEFALGKYASKDNEDADIVGGNIYCDSIANGNPETNKEIIMYGMEALLMDVLGFALTVFVGVCFHYIIGSIFTWVFLYPLRKYAGGYHASTRIRCTILSIAILTLSFYVILKLNIVRIDMCIIFICSFLLWCFAPVSTANKRLDSVEVKEYRKRTRVLVLIDIAVYIFAATFSIKVIAASITISLFIVGTSVLAGKIKENQES